MSDSERYYDENLLEHFINKELDECQTYKKDQLEQIKWFVQLYSFIFAGYLSFTAYMLRLEVNWCYTSLGISSVFLIFFIGWLFPAILSHKISSIVLANKHLALFRSKRLELARKTEAVGDLYNYYIFSVSNKAYIATIIRYIPYGFAFLNYLILCGSVFIYIFRQSSYHHAIFATIFTGVFVAVLYPQSCVYFYQNPLTAKVAKSFPDKARRERQLKKIRKRNQQTQRIQYFFCWFTLILLILIIFCSWIKQINFHNKVILAILSTFIIIFFNLIRFRIEQIKGIRVKLD